MGARHVKDVVEREKLDSLRLNTAGHQILLMTLASLEGCCIEAIDDIRVISPEKDGGR
jgi:hypothetical protein